MLSLEQIKAIDKSQMYKIYDNWPDIAKEAFMMNSEQIEYKNINNIIFAGVGGSGTIGDIFSSILSKTDIHTSVVKGYLLPKTTNNNSLIIISSVSGNTDEAFNILKSANHSNFKTICFSSGGKIEDYCLKNKIYHKHIEKIHSPRASLTKFLYTIIKTIQPIIPIRDEEVFESISELSNIKKIINSNFLTKKNPSLELAEWISNMPIIYYPWGLQAAAIRFKSCLQENAKLHTFAEDVIEASHNGIVSWEKDSLKKPILIRGRDDYEKTINRWEIFKEYFKQNNIEYMEIYGKGNSILSKLITLIYLLDYSSIYRAILSGIDPTPVKSIDFIKKQLAN